MARLLKSAQKLGTKFWVAVVSKKEWRSDQVDQNQENGKSEGSGAAFTILRACLGDFMEGVHHDQSVNIDNL